MYTGHGSGADLPFLCVQPRSNIGYRKIYSIVGCNPTVYAFTLNLQHSFICGASHSLWYDMVLGGLEP